MTDVPALQQLVAAEYAAVYGYGLVGARLRGAEADLARAAIDAHRARRDQLLAALADRAGAPPPDQPGYAVTATTRGDALALAGRLEDGVGRFWRQLVLTTADRALRDLGITGLMETAVRGADWRWRSGSQHPTEPLPGS